MSAAIKTEHKTKHVETLRVNPSDVKKGRNSRMIPAPDYGTKVTDRAISIFKSGQLQPCEVRRLEDKTLELTYGFTRYDAVELLRKGFDAIDPDTGEFANFHQPDLQLWVKLVDTNPDEAFIRSIVENQAREPVTDLQEALAQQELRTTLGYSNTKIAALYGYSNQNRVMNLEKLLLCPEDIQQKVHKKDMALSVAILGPKHHLTHEEQLKLMTEAATDGSISGPAYTNLLRDLIDVKAAKGSPETPAAGGEEGAGEEPKDEEPKEEKGPNIKRNVKDLERFLTQEKGADDGPGLGAASEEFLDVLILWFKGRRNDEYLKKTLKEYIG